MTDLCHPLKTLYDENTVISHYSQDSAPFSSVQDTHQINFKQSLKANMGQDDQDRSHVYITLGDDVLLES